MSATRRRCRRCRREREARAAVTSAAQGDVEQLPRPVRSAAVAAPETAPGRPGRRRRTPTRGYQLVACHRAELAAQQRDLIDTAPVREEQRDGRTWRVVQLPDAAPDPEPADRVHRGTTLEWGARIA